MTGEYHTEETLFKAAAAIRRAMPGIHYKDVQNILLAMQNDGILFREIKPESLVEVAVDNP